MKKHARTPADVFRGRRIVVGLALILAAAVWPGPASGQEADVAQIEARTQRLAGQVNALWGEIEDLFAQFAGATGEERLILDAQIDRRAARFRPAMAEAIGAILELEGAGGDAGAYRTDASEWLVRARGLVRDELQQVQDRMSELRVRRSGLTRAELLPTEREISQVGVETDALLLALFRVAGFRSQLGEDPAEDFNYLEPLLTARAERLSGEITLSQIETRDLGARLERATGDEERVVRAELTVMRERLRAGTTGLAAMVDLMDQRDIEAAEYKQLLIQATGQVTTDVLDINVALGLLRQGWTAMTTWALSRAPQLVMNVLLFVLILIVFRILARLSGRIVSAAIARSNSEVPKLLKTMGVSIISNAVFLLGILIGLSQLGIHIGPLLAGLGVAGFIMGFALQDSLSNFAAGMMILVYQPFDVGDVVEAGGVGGKVSDMSLVSTTVLTFDNQRLIVPNRAIWGDVIRNKTAEVTRRVDLTVDIGGRDDVARAEAVLNAIVSEHPLVLKDPSPTVKVHSIDDSSIEFIVRPWVNTGDYWAVYWDVTRQMSDRFETEGISRPFSRSELRIAGGGAPPEEVVPQA